MQSHFHRTIGAVLTALLLSACSSEPPDPGAWPQWRGPAGNGVTTATGLPLHWDEEGNGIRWQVEVPDEGVSSPIVSGGQIFLTSEEPQGEETLLKVMSFDLETGALQWQTPVFTRVREKFPHRMANNSAAGPTALADGRHVFAYFGSHLAKLSYDGGLVWVKEIDPFYVEDAYYGAGSSVLPAGDRIIIFRDRETLDADKNGWIAAFDKKDASEVWRDQWSNTCCSYSTPIIVERETASELVVAMAQKVVSYDLDSGEQLWQRKHVSRQPVSSPVAEGDIVCAATGAHGHRGAACYRFNEREGGRAKELWTANKGVPETASPVLYKGMLFTVNDKGIMICRDAVTGKQHWMKRLHQGNYYSSLVAGDDKIYATSRDGMISVLAAEPRYRLLALNQLPPGGRITASSAVAGGCLIVRSAEKLYCVEGTGQAETAQPKAG